MNAVMYQSAGQGRRRQWWAGGLALMVTLVGCGGGDNTINPLSNPSTVSNPVSTGGQKLSFVYFQRCINDILQAQLASLQGSGTNSCAGSGCHDSVNGTGGALRVVQGAVAVDLADPGNSAAVIRTSDMYKNYYSAQGVTVVGSASQSRLLNKPMLLVQHAGGQIFASLSDVNAARIAYWINHPQGQDEFSSAASMFTPQNSDTGECNQ